MAQHLAETTVTVTGVVAFPTAPQIAADFDLFEVQIVYTGGSSGVIQYSFDGTNVHGRVTDDADLRIMVERAGSERSIWFRELVAGTGSTTCRVTASTER